MTETITSNKVELETGLLSGKTCSRSTSIFSIDSEASGNNWIIRIVPNFGEFLTHSVNAIPEAFADELARRLNWPVDRGVVQVNIVSHTGADGFSRLARQAKFEGAIRPGAEYVMVDDFVGMGGTLANLRGHIETNGGKVAAAVALTGKPHSAKLRLEPHTLDELRHRHGPELEHWWQGRFAHAFDALTESEARYLARSPDADAIRNRIAAAEQAGNRP
jgi:hypothetical protein